MLWDEPEFIKISPPGFLYQNSAVETKYSKGEILMLSIEYEIDNVLDIGEGQTCNPDPSYSRDECVINQLLNVKTLQVCNMYIYDVTNCDFSEINGTIRMHTTSIGELWISDLSAW